ncbi:hypothetical protein [Streptosporangium carneum]|nr:hypothetical protein [Streptosporangium carneum]
MDPELGAMTAAPVRLADDARRAWRAHDAGASEEVAAIMQTPAPNEQ